MFDVGIGDPEYRAQFDLYRRGADRTELRSLKISDFGVVAPQTFYDRLVSRMKSYAGAREAGATVLTTEIGSDLPIAFNDDVDHSATMVAEGATNNSVVDPSVSNKILKSYKFDTDWIKVSIEFDRDSKIPTMDIVADIAAKRVGRALNPYTNTGTGSSEPQGVVSAATVGKTAAAPNAVTYAEWQEFFRSVDAAYRNSGRCALMLHDDTLQTIRNLKDESDRLLFPLGSEPAGVIMGYRYVINNDMDAIGDGAGSTVAAFGNFSGYFIRDVLPTIVIARELFANAGNIGYRVFSRHDAKLVDAHAVKSLKLASS